MRIIILYIIYGVIAIVLQTTWLAGLPTETFQFNLLLPAIVYLGFSCGRSYAIPIIVVLGTFYDVQSAGPFGMALCSYLIIYSLIRMIISKITYQSNVSRFMWVGIASALDKGVGALLLLIWGEKLAISEFLLGKAIIQALLDSAMGVVLIPFLAWYSDLRWSKLFRPKKIVIE
jgi:rod shape-determining protein MreD